jgi:hypothetical protein
MGDNSSSSRPARHALAWVILSAAVVLGASASVSAQDSARGYTDAIVEVTASGGEVRAAGANVTVQGEADSIQAAGANVHVRATVKDDVQIAGAQVSFDGDVGGSLKAAGASLDIRGRFAKTSYVAGAVVVLNAVVGEGLRIAGANVTIGPGTDIAGDLKGGAANLTVSGHVAGRADLAGGLVTINARIDGPVEVRGAQVVIGAPARIGGNLTVYSLRDPIIAEGAVTGTVTRISPPDWWSSGTAWVWMVGIAAAIAAGTVLAGIVMLLFGGRVFATATGHVRHRPLSSFLFGILALVLIPFIAVVLMATIIGISVGFAILLVLPFLLIFGHAVAAAGIAAGILVRRTGDLGVGLGLLMLIIGAIIIVALGLIPIVGPIIVLIALVLGVGAFTRTIGSRMRRAETVVIAT